MTTATKWTEEDIADVLAAHFNTRTNVVVPNVSWSLLNHEADLIVMTKAGKVHEIEIKTSVADTKNDSKKIHGHQSRYVDKLWFCFPWEIGARCIPLIPEDYGVLLITEDNRVITHRQARQNQIVRPDPAFRENLLRLGYLRYWSLRGVRG